MIDYFERKKDLEDFVIKNSNKIMEAIAKDLNIPVSALYYAFSSDKKIQDNVFQIIERHMKQTLNKQLN